MDALHQYWMSFLIALGASLALTPIMRRLALRWNILDHPWTDIKTHKAPVPYFGGVAIAMSFLIAIIVARFTTDFPTGTLRALRGIVGGGVFIFLLGLIDDVIPKGLGYKKKFLFQITAAVALILFDIRIRFIEPAWFADLLTIVWVVGVINAVNIIDIMDGLAGGVAMIAALAFLFISTPGEQIYVNFAAAALAGAHLGFLPYNLSARWKIFMGDTGSLFTGFILAALSLGTSYTRVNNMGVFVPLVILGLPIYDTLFVMSLRSLRGASPFVGSKDHFALRLEAMGFYREEILFIAYGVGLVLAFSSYLITTVSTGYAVLLYGLIAGAALFISRKLARIRIDL